MSFLKKVKSLFGFSDSTTKEYGYKVNKFHLNEFGEVEYAQWLHPFEEAKIIDKITIDFYKQFIKAGDFVIDIGAHTGDTTVPIALCASKEGLVLALEPNPYVFKILEKNSTLNNSFTNIHAINFAATREDGKFNFNYSDEAFCNGGFFDEIQSNEHGHNYTLEISGIDLNRYLSANYSQNLDKLSLIKIDAEGYDKEIIKSLIPIIEKYKPCIITECNENLSEQERYELFEIIKSLDYKLEQIDNFDSSTVTGLDRKEDMLKTKHFDIIATPSKNI